MLYSISHVCPVPRCRFSLCAKPRAFNIWAESGAMAAAHRSDSSPSSGHSKSPVLLLCAQAFTSPLEGAYFKVVDRQPLGYLSPPIPFPTTDISPSLAGDVWTTVPLEEIQQPPRN